MTDFTIQVAGCTVAVQALFAGSRDYCRDYLCQARPDFSITVTAADIALEREIAARTESALQNLPDAQLEITAIQRKITEALFDYDTVLFHGSAVAVDGTGYLFTAKSGTGKSTHTRLWRQVLGDRAVMVNDDKPFLRITGQGILVCGSPWNGKHRLGNNITLPLKAICILERGAENRIEKITAGEALPMLLQQSARPVVAGKIPRYMELLDAIAAQVDFYRLRCNMDPDAARVAYGAMAASDFHREDCPKGL